MSRRIIAPAYETDIAIPPQFGCICGKCKKNGEPISCHHNAFEEPYYKDPPGVRRQASRHIISLFRGSEYNRFYVTNCKHLAIQPTGFERAKRPTLDVIDQFIGETSILTNIDRTVYLSNKNLYGKYMGWQESMGFSPREIKRKIYTDWLSRNDSIEMLDTISVIPEEVVTAALVYSAPLLAAERLETNPNQTLVAPASWPKRRFRELINTSLELREGTKKLGGLALLSLQTGVDEIELAAA